MDPALESGTPLRQSPVCWLERTLAAIRAELDVTDDDPLACEPVGVSFRRLTDPGDSFLPEEFTRLRCSGVPAVPAASLLVSWYAGPVAEAVAIGLAGGGAFVPLPHTIRWRVHPGGWPLDVRAAYRVSVAPRSPWAGEPGVAVLPAPALPVIAAEGLIEACRPIVEACRRLTDAPAPELWSQVADHVGTALTLQTVLPADEEAQRRVDAALRVKGAPWRVRPAPGDRTG